MTPTAAPSLPPPPPPRWELRPAPSDEVVSRLVDALSLPRALCAVLAGRGIHEPGPARDFLRPRIEEMHPPVRLADAGRAVERLERAIDRGETIFVHGDYDVDGVCSAALLTRSLRSLGATVVPFVPHRLRDGYDLSRSGVERAQRAGATLLVTCDAGIVAHDAIRYAGELGIDVVVTDHHTPGATLPAAVAVVNPNRTDCTYPDKGLCGAGVVFKLMELLFERRGRDRQLLLPHLDLVALATIADLVPLVGENRIFARFGLRYLAHTSKEGLRALLSVCGMERSTGDGSLEAGQVGFQLAPRINAAGRLGDAGDALELLLTENRDRARRLADELDRLNTQRRAEDQRTLDEALRTLALSFDPADDFGVVLAGEGWHPGVIGIVASRVVERIHRPVVLIALDGDAGRGSARSIPELHLYDALLACDEHLDRFGGHRQAAGMDVRRSSVDPLRLAFNHAVRTQLSGSVPAPRLRADLRLSLDEATPELHHWLDYLGPFGMGNPRPVFVARDAEIQGAPMEVGRGHLKLRLAADRGSVEAIGFGLAERLPPQSLPRRVELAFQLRENEYRGRRTLQARLMDLRPGGSA